MVEKNDKVDDIEVPDEEDLEGLDETTDWKVKADELQKKYREAGIHNRERTKSLLEQIAALNAKLVETTAKPPEKKEPDESLLLQRLDNVALRSADITAEDEVELAKDFQKRTGMDIEGVISDDIYQARLAKLRTEKSNKQATSNIKGGGGTSQAKHDPQYWIAKKEFPNPQEVPDRKIRAKIIRTIHEKEEGAGGGYYNE